MCIVMDTADKMNVQPDMVFAMWGCFQEDITAKEVERLYDAWYYEGKITQKMESFCLDILTDRIPLITLPVPKQKARKKM